MSTEISGGGLYWKSGIDNSGFDQDVVKIEQGLKRIESAAQTSGAVLDKSFSNMSTEKLTINIGIAEEKLKGLIAYSEKKHGLGFDTNTAKSNIASLQAQIKKMYAELDSRKITTPLPEKNIVAATEAIKGLNKSSAEVIKTSSGVTKGMTAAWGAIKGFGASLLSIAGVAGIYGVVSAAVIELVKNLKWFKKELTDVEKAQADQKSVNDAAIDGYIKQKVIMESLSERVRQSGKSLKEKESILKTYNKEFGESIGKANSYSEAENYIISRGPAFIESLRARANEMAAMGLAIEAAKESIKLSEKAPEEFLNGIQRFDYKISKWQRDFFSSQTGFNWLSKEGGKVIDQYDQIGKIAQFKAETAEDEKQRRMIAISEKYRKIREQKEGGFNFKYGDEGKEKKLRDRTREIIADREKLLTLQKEIKDSGSKFSYIDDSDEIRKINSFFDDLKHKIDQFNKDPKNKVKLGYDVIERNREAAISNFDYSQETKDLLKEFDDKKQIYQDYADFKNKAGQEAADKEYKSLIGKYDTYVAYLESEEQKLWDKGALTPIENDRFIKVQKARIEAQKDAKAAQTKELAEMLNKYASYEQKRKVLTEQKQAEINKAIKNGQYSLVSEINKSYQQQFINLDEEHAKEISDSNQFFEGLILNSKRAVKAQIEVIKELLNSSAIDDKSRAKLLNDLKNLEGLLNVKNEDLELTQIDKQLEDVNKRIKDIENGAPLAEGALQNLFDEKVRLKLQKGAAQLQKISEKAARLQAVGRGLSDIGQSLSQLGDTDPKLANLGNTLSRLGQTISDFSGYWEKMQNNTLKTSDAIAVAASFIANAISEIAASAEQAKQKEAEALQNVIDFQRGYNLALIEEQKIKSNLAGNVFYQNSLRTIKTNLKEQVSLVNEYNQAMKDLEKGQVKVGTKKVRDWAAVGASTLSGVTAGAIALSETGPGAAVGAVVGGVVGFVVGMLKKRQVVDVYDNLLKRYPKLIDEEGKLNDAMAKSLLSSNLLDAKTKETLQYVTELAKKYEDAKKEIDEVVKSLIGDVGNNIMANLVDDFKNGGKNAGEAFRKGFAKSLERLYEDVIYAAVLGKGLEEMQTKINKGFEAGDMDIMQKAMYDFLDTYQSRAQTGQDLMKQMQEYAKTKGIDIWKDKGSSSSVKGTISNSITEETGTIISGTAKGIQLTVNEILKFNTSFTANFFNDSLRLSQLKFDTLLRIEKNTGDTATNTAYLKKILDKMDSQPNALAATGFRNG